MRKNGTVPVDSAPYYIGWDVVRHAVALVVDAMAGEFIGVHRGQEVKRLPIKGVAGRCWAVSGAMAETATVTRAAHTLRTHHNGQAATSSPAWPGLTC